VLLSADPISGEFARMLDGSEDDSEAEDIAALIQEVDQAASAESESVDAASEGVGGDEITMNWPAGWESEDRVSEDNAGADDLASDNPQPVAVTVLSLVVDEAIQLRDAISGDDDLVSPVTDSANANTDFGLLAHVQARGPPDAMLLIEGTAETASPAADLDLGDAAKHKSSALRAPGLFSEGFIDKSLAGLWFDAPQPGTYKTDKLWTFLN